MIYKKNPAETSAGFFDIFITLVLLHG